jgi:chromosome segregation ATPase
MQARQDMDARARDEERRRREAVTINNLQQQIDELRALLRDHASRVGRGDEIVKNVEASIADIRADLDDHRRSTVQYAQARQLDENRFRSALTDMHGGISEAHGSIRQLQAQTAELIEQSRARRDTTELTNRRFDELQSQITRAFAQQDRLVEVMKSLRESIEEVRVEAAQARRDYQRVDDAIRIVDSEAKRRVVEVEQRIEVLPPRIEESLRRVSAVETAFKSLGEEFARIHNALQHLADIETRQDEITSQFNEQALERHDLVLERIEEVRQQGDAVSRDLRHAAEERDAYLASRIDISDDALRDVAHRISLVNTRVDEVGQRIADVRRELARASEQQVRSRFKQVQQELEEVVELNRRVLTSEGGEEPGSSHRPTLRALEPRGDYVTGGGQG